MKTATLLCVAVLAAACDRPTEPVAPAAAPAGLVDVDDLMRHVEEHRGTVRVRGVVSEASAEDRAVGLIDVCEFERCGTTTCASLTLPVRWEGPMPRVAETVVVEGTVADEGGRMIFVARSMERPQEGGP